LAREITVAAIVHSVSLGLTVVWQTIVQQDLKGKFVKIVVFQPEREILAVATAQIPTSQEHIVNHKSLQLIALVDLKANNV